MRGALLREERVEVQVAVHVELEPAVGVHVGPENRGEAAPTCLGELVRPLGLGQDFLDQVRVDVDQSRLEEVQVVAKAVSPGAVPAPVARRYRGETRQLRAWSPR